MGCCNSDQKAPEEAVIIERIKAAIDMENTIKLRPLIAILDKIQKINVPAVDRPLVTSKEITLNTLSYAIWQGRSSTFTYVYENLHPDIKIMEELLANHNMSVLDIIIQKGSLDILTKYIPIYLDNEISLKNIAEIHQNHDLPPNIYTPIQKACELGNISIISHIFNYFKNENNTKTPKALDINFQEESSGENCPLIACRTCNFPMIKFLHEVCKANFNVKNHFNENAINVCLAGARRDPKLRCFECVSYLVEVVKIDPTHMYEDSLLMADDPKAVFFLEDRLRERGVNVRKKEIEKVNLIKQAPIPKTDLEMDLDQISHDQFSIRDYISSQSEVEDLDETLVLSIENFSVLNSELCK